MEALRALIPLLLTISLAGLLLAVGLNSERGDLVYVLKRPKLLAKGVLAVVIIPPIAAGLLVAVLPLQPAVEAGIMLMAVSPVPPLVPGKELKIGGRKAYAYGLYVALALLTVVTVPTVLAVTSLLFGRHDTFPLVSMAETVVLGVLLPLGVGVVVQRLAPALAARAFRIVYLLSMVLVLAAFVPIVVKVWPALTALMGNGTMLVMGAVSLIALAAGHLLGGPEPQDRATLAVAAATRHPGTAMAIAAASFDKDPRVIAAVLLFLLVGLVVGIPYQAWVKRQPPASNVATAT